MKESELALALRSVARHLGGDICVARSEAHAIFDRIWKSRHMTRTEAYGWLAKQMRLPKTECHMEKFTLEQCQTAIQICKEMQQ